MLETLQDFSLTYLPLNLAINHRLHCGGLMEPGCATIRGTILGFFVIGFSYQHLWFQKNTATKAEIVVRSGDIRQSHRCVDCDAVSILPFPRI